ncbi:MAG: transposase [Chloroflexi bacterium]|nr:transposase [Chloroflexota bacterium]
MQRTIRVRLRPTVEQASALFETARLFTLAFNAVAAHGWQHGEKNGVTLHHATYRPLKMQYPSLVSDLHIQARVKATEAVKSALALQKQGRKTGRPQSAACPPRYNLHTVKVDWQASIATLSTTSGRQRIPFDVFTYAARYVGGDVATADLMYRAGAWWLHVVVTVEAPAIVPTDAVVGVDLGIAQPAVTSTGLFLGKKAWRNREARRFQQRRALQQRGTKSAKRRLKMTRRAQARFRRDCDHVLSKRIVQATPPGGTIALENLTNIRKRVTVRHGQQARRVHGWSFDQIRSFVEYKAEERGVTVSGVDPRNTSTMCSSCGHIARKNRRSRGWFTCRACGFQLHADLNAARNIAAKYRVAPGIAGDDGVPVMHPIAGEAELAHAFTCKLPALAGSS